MKKAVIHIGTGKTGTSSIQRTLASNDLGSITYPQNEAGIGGRNHPHALFSCLCQEPDKLPRSLKSQANRNRELFHSMIQEGQRNLYAEIRGNDKIIISSEFLSSFDANETDLFRENLEKLDIEDVRVIVYVREPVSYYISLAQQQLKASNVIVSPKNFRYKFRECIDNWNKTYPGKLIVRPFEKEALHKQCVVRDFLRIASGFLSADVGDIRIFNNNESLSAEAMLILQKYRHLFYRDSNNLFCDDSDYLVRILQNCALPQTKPRAKDEAAALVMSNHWHDLQWLDANFGIDFLPDKEPFSDNPAHISEGRAWNVTEVLKGYDEKVVEELLLHSLKAALTRRLA